MKYESAVDEWWAKIVSTDSLRVKIIRHLVEKGPSSAYDIAKQTYNPASKGYPAIFRNLKDLESEKIVQRTSTEASKKGGEKNLYALTEFIGIPCAWAYLGKDLNFPRLLESHATILKGTKGLDVYKVIWEELGSEFCVMVARKSFLAIIEGLDDKSQIFNILVPNILDGSISEAKISSIGSRSDLIEVVIRETRDQLTKMLDQINKRQLRG